MSEHMRKLRINEDKKVIHFLLNGVEYVIPSTVAKKYEVKPESKTIQAGVPADEVFADLVDLYSKPGILLKGIRAREGLTQVAMAKRLKITQANLSKMENGKRRIGRILAQRIAKEFGVNYRSLLD